MRKMTLKKGYKLTDCISVNKIKQLLILNFRYDFNQEETVPCICFIKVMVGENDLLKSKLCKYMVVHEAFHYIAQHCITFKSCRVWVQPGILEEEQDKGGSNKI